MKNGQHTHSMNIHTNHVSEKTNRVHQSQTQGKEKTASKIAKPQIDWIKTYKFLLNTMIFICPSIATAQMIRPDGMTATNVNVNGNIYNVTTGTVSGNNAFNSFHTFDVYKGTTVNLILPNQTQNLINLIHDKATNIDGILNSYQNGQIGGNVLLLNPNGIMVGANGVVNVGSITMATPDAAFLKTLVSNGKINQTAVNAVLDGDMPISPSGTVSVKGKIKAQKKVAVRAQHVKNEGEIRVKPNLSDLVNTGNAQIEHQDISIKDGAIIINAEQDFTNAGTIAVEGKNNKKTNGINIQAGNDIVLEKNAVISADGKGVNSSGGDIILKAKNDAVLKEGSKLSAKGGASGDGGFIELSADNRVDLAGGQFDTSAQDGETGVAYIDPDTVEISQDQTSSSNIVIEGRVVSVKDNVKLTAKNADITITAKNGAKDGNDYTSGTLTNGKAVAGITIGKNAQLDADNINLSALNVIETGWGSSGEPSLSGFLGVSLLDAETYIRLSQGASLSADNDISLNLESIAKAKATVGTMVVSASYAELNHTAEISVTDAIMNAGGNISLKSALLSSVDLDAYTVASKDSNVATGFAGSFAYGQMFSDNTISVSGGSVTAGKNINVEATTDKNMTVKAATVGLISSVGALDVAIAESEVNNKALINSAVSGKDVNVVSDIHSITSTNASGNAGLGNLGSKFVGAVENKVQALTPDAILNLITSTGAGKKITDAADNHQQGQTQGQKATIKIAGAISYVDHQNTAEAVIGAQGDVQAQNDINVQSKVYDVATNAAEASASGGSSDDNQAKNAVAAAVTIADFQNTSRAYISGNAQVDAVHRLNVQSDVIMPPKYTAEGSTYFNLSSLKKGESEGFWNDFVDSSETLWGTIFEHANTNLGILDEFYNSWAKSSANLDNPDDSDQQFAGNGSVNLTDYWNNSVAFIGEGAKINQRNTAQAGNRVVDVNAGTDVTGVNLGGMVGLPSSTETGQGVGVGASFMMTRYNNTTGAFIGNNAKVDAEGLNVSAELENQNISTTVAFGKSENLGINGMMNFLKTENNTIAQVSGGAQVSVNGGIDKNAYKDATGKNYTERDGTIKSYDAVHIRTYEDSLFVNATGDMAKKDGGSTVVAAVTVSQVNRLAHAVLGDIRTDLMSTTALSNWQKALQSGDTLLYDLTRTGASDGYFSTPSALNVTADADGLNVSVAIAASKTKSDAGNVPGVDVSDPDDVEDGVELEDFDEEEVEAPADITSEDQKQKGKFGMGISASFSWNQFANDVAAYLKNARYNGRDTRNANDINLTAGDKTESYAVTGGVSLELAKNKGTNVAVGASASYNTIQDNVRAVIDNSSVSNVKDVTADAQNNTKMMALAIGAAAGMAENGVTLNGSATVNDIANTTEASILNSTITGRNIRLTAKDKSWLLQTGLGLSVSNNAGGGAVAGWNNVSNTVKALAQNNQITAGDLTLNASNEMDIRSISTGGAASAKGAVALTGAYNNISNTTEASVTGSQTDDEAQKIKVDSASLTATDDSDILAISTGAGIGKKLGANIVVGVNRIGNTTRAGFETVDVAGTAQKSPVFKATAVNKGVIRSFANSVGVGEYGGLGNVGTYNSIYNTTETFSRNALLSGTSLSFSSQDRSYILAETAGAGISSGIGLGLAVSINRIGNTLRAVAENSKLNMTGDVSLTAQSYPSDTAPTDDLPQEAGDISALDDVDKRSITTITVGAGVGNYGAGLAGTYADVQNTIESAIKGGTVQAQNIQLSAIDQANILNIGVAAGGGKTAGIAGLSTTNIIKNQVKATIGYDKDEKNTATDITTDENIRLTAAENSTINAITAAAAGGGSAGVAGNIAYNEISNSIQTGINQAGVSVDGSIDLTALAQDNANFYYGTVAGGAGVGVGGVIGLNFLNNKASANIDSSDLIVNGTTAIDNRYGLITNATVSDDVAIYGGSAGGAGNIGISGSVGFAQVNNEAETKLTESSVTTDSPSANNSGADMNATNETAVQIYAGAVGGAGSTGIGGAVTTAVIRNNTIARAEKSYLDLPGDISLDASDTTHFNGAVVAGGGAGGTGIGASVNVALIENTVDSALDSSIAKAGKNLSVEATGVTGIGKSGVPAEENDDFKNNAFVIGGAGVGGTLGLGISMNVAQVQNTVSAKIKNSHAQATENLSVSADDTTHITDYIIAAGMGGMAGVAGSLGVHYVDSSVTAGIESDQETISVGNINEITQAAGKNISVTADNNMNHQTVMTVVGAGGTGVGASVNVSTLRGSTDAHIQGAMDIIADEDISVDALTTRGTDIKVITGGGGGMAGVAGAISVSTLGHGDNNSSAYTSGTQDGEKQGTDDTVAQYLAENEKALNSAQSQKLFMTKDAEDTGIKKSDSLSVQINSSEGNGSLSGKESSSNTNNQQSNLSAENASERFKGTRAFIDLGNKALTAGQDIQVSAKDTVNSQTLNGGVGVGGFAAVGASVAVANIDTNTQAFIQNATVVASGDVSVESGLDETADALTFAAAGAQSYALSGAISVVNSHNINDSFLGNNAVISKAKNLSVRTNGDATLSAETIGASVSMTAGVGASVTEINKSGESNAWIDSNASVGQEVYYAKEDTDYTNPLTRAEMEEIIGRPISDSDFTSGEMGADGKTTVYYLKGDTAKKRPFTATEKEAYISLYNADLPTEDDFVHFAKGEQVETLLVNAIDTVNLTAETTAAAGGVVSGAGTSSGATISDKQKAVINSGADIAVLKSADIKTNASAKANATTLGVAVGGAAVSTSLSRAEINLDNTAEVQDNVTLSAENATVEAYQSKADAFTDSLAAAGALLAGNGADSNSTVSGRVSADIGAGAEITAKDTLSVTAKAMQNANAVASAYRGGLLAAGAALADSRTNVDTRTRFENGVIIEADSLNLNAVNDITLYGETVSGSGSLIGGAAAISTTANDSSAQVQLGTSETNPESESLYNLNSLSVTAENKIKQNAFSDSINASLLGGSGATTNNTSVADAQVDMNGKSNVAVNNVAINATNTFEKKNSANQAEVNINSGSGGIVDAAAVQSETTTNHSAKVVFGKEAQFNQNTGKKSSSINATADEASVDGFTVNAVNNITAEDKVRLVSGGAIPIAKIITKIKDNADSLIEINGSISSGQDIVMNAHDNVNITTDGEASTYGLSAVAGGEAESSSVANNTIRLADGSSLYSDKNVYLSAGQVKEDQSNKTTLKSLTQLWNNSAVPISDNTARAQLNLTNLIDLQKGSVLKSGQDAFLTSQTSQEYEIVGQADSHNPYNQAFATNATTYDSDGLHENSAIAINGSLFAGVNNEKHITIDQDGHVHVVGANGKEEDASQYYTETQKSLYTEMQTQMTNLQQMLADYGNDPVYKAFYEQEINALKEQMKAMGLLVEYVDKGGNEQFYIREDITTPYIQIHDLQAGAGAVELLTDNVTGSGNIETTSGAEISITNNSNRFLELNDLTINERESGLLRYNHKTVSPTAETDSSGFYDTFTGQVNLASGDTTDQSITIKSTYVENTDTGIALSPSVDILGNVINYNGNIDITAAGAIYTDGVVRGKSINMTTGGAIVQKANDLVYHVGGDPSSAWNDTASKNEAGSSSATPNVSQDLASYDSALIASGNIYLSGRYLNLNGLVQSGTSDFKMNLQDGHLKLTSAGKTLTVEQAKADYASKAQTNADASPLYALVKDDNNNVTAYFNVLTNQIEIDDVRIQGGYIELHGQIMNTSASTGELRVADGYGRLSVNNKSGYDIVLNNVNLNEKIIGMIKITDTGKNNETTVYLRDGNTIRQDVFAADGTQKSSTTITAGIDENGYSSTTYNTASGQRYQWMTGIETTTQRETTYNTSTFWDIDWLSPDDDDIIAFKEWNLTDSPLREGESVLTAQNNPYTYSFSKQTVTLNDWTEVNRKQWTDTKGWWIFSTQENYTKITEQKGTKTYYTHSLKADNPIKVSFSGFQTGQTDVQSNGNIYLQGDILTKNGSVVLNSTNGKIDSLSNAASVNADTIHLSAQTGIGAEESLNITLTGNGLLTADNTGTGDISLNALSGNVLFDNITTADGDISVHAFGNITGDTSQSLISGNHLTLTAENGTISTKDNGALNIQTSSTDGTLTAFADGDIKLTQANGDLGIVQVASRQGNVELTALQGGIYDANDESQENQQTKAELEKRWENMGLTGLSGELLDKAVEAFENQKTAEYQAYWEQRNQTGNTQFTYSAEEKAVLSDSLIRSVKTEKEIAKMSSDEIRAITDPMITALEAEITARFEDTVYDTSYRYTATSEDKAQLARGAGWNKSQLEYSFAVAKLDTQVGTQTTVEEPNLVGKKVVVNANGSIGRDNGEITLSVDDMENWSEQEKLIFTAAERDNVSLSEDGKEVTVSLREDLDIHASDSLTLQAKDYVYLGAEENIYIDKIMAGDETNRQNISIAGAGNIYQVSTDSSPALTGNDVVLESANGSIGTQDIPVSVDLVGKINARAQNDIYLTSVDKNGALNDLNVDYLYAANQIGLTGKNISDSRNDDLVNIRSNKVILNASEDIGSAENAVDVALTNTDDSSELITVSGKNTHIQNAESGQLTITAESGENLTVTAPSGNIYVAKATAKGNTDLTAQAGDMDIETISADGNMRLYADQSLRINQAQSNGNMDLQSGDLTAENILSGDTLSIQAHTSDIFINTAESNHDATIIADAGNITIQNGLLSRLGNGIVKALKKALTAHRIETAQSLTVETGSDLQADTLVSGTNADITVGGKGVIDSLISGADITLTVEKDAEIESLDATGNATISIGKNAAIQSAQADKNITLTVQNGSTTVNKLSSGEKTTLVANGGDVLLNEVVSGDDIAGETNNGNVLINNMKSNKNISFTAQNGDLDIGLIEAMNGSATLSAEQGNIMGITDDTSVRAQTVTLGLAGQNIGSENRPMKIEANLANASAKENIYVSLRSPDETATDTHFGTFTSESGNITLTAENENAVLNGEVSARNGHISLFANQSIQDKAQSENGTLQANTLTLMAQNGKIGDESAYIQVDSSTLQDGWIDAQASNGIFINETKGPMYVRQLAVEDGDLKMHVNSSILGAKNTDKEPHIIAESIELHSNEGSIGSSDNGLVMQINDTRPGRINLQAATGIHFEKTTSDLWSDYMVITDSGKIQAYFPSGHVRVQYLQAPNGADFLFTDRGQRSNLWLATKDIESVLLDSKAMQNPLKQNQPQDQTPFEWSYELQFKNHAGQIMEKEDWKDYFIEASLK